MDYYTEGGCNRGENDEVKSVTDSCGNICYVCEYSELTSYYIITELVNEVANNGETCYYAYDRYDAKTGAFSYTGYVRYQNFGGRDPASSDVCDQWLGNYYIGEQGGYWYNYTEH